MNEYRRPSSVGANIHPSTSADEITATIAGAIVGLRALAETTADPEWAELADRFNEPLPRANRKMQKLYERMVTLRMVSPATWRKARDGDIPWPEQKGRAATWVPPCRCWDPCAIHDLGRERTEDQLWECNCETRCEQCDRPAGYKWRKQREANEILSEPDVCPGCGSGDPGRRLYPKPTIRTTDGREVMKRDAGQPCTHPWHDRDDDEGAEA